MRRDSLRELIGRLWNSGCRRAFSDEVLLRQLQNDGGHDAEDLTAEVIADLLDEKHPDDWGITTFAFSELSAFYLARSLEMSFHEVVCAVFSSCGLADAARVGSSDWSPEHDKIMALCAILAGRIGLEDFLHVMAYIFGKGADPPISLAH